MKPTMKTMKELFKSKTKIVGTCWNWQGNINSEGYGRVTVMAKTFLAHRFSYELFNGKSPGTKVVCHKCDSHPCVNPGHLFIGEPKDNSSDMIKKGRSAYGTKNNSAKLREPDVLEIRRLYKEIGIPAIEIAKMFRIAETTVFCIVNRKTWVHI